jgi:hypothetical protein
MVDENVLRQAYEQARMFYKGHAKAENKRYDRDIAPEKHERREALLAPLLPRFYEQFRHPDSLYKKFLAQGGYRQAVSLGDSLRRARVRIGNCGEMFMVTASFLNEADPSVPKALGYMQPPGDHGFLVAGDTSIAEKTMQDLAEFKSDEPSFILDTWAGIFCYTKDYYYEFKTKMTKWTGEGKRVAVRGTILSPMEEYLLNATSATIQVIPL